MILSVWMFTILVPVIAVVVIVCHPDHGIPCRDDQFLCSYGHCIHKGWLCDGTYHCKDTSDEINCDDYTCNEYQFKCDDGSCIHLGYVCDTSNDCRDGSDEFQCDNHACNVHQFGCATLGGSCIHLAYQCDGTADCISKEDEACSAPNHQCNEVQFKCPNGNCIADYLQCSGNDDCGDGSTELHCVFTKCPSNDTVVVDIGWYSVLVDYTSNLSTRRIATWEKIFLQPNPYDLFPLARVIGVHHFYFTGTSDFGTMDFCQFWVTVLDLEAPVWICPEQYITWETDMANDEASVDFSLSMSVTDNSISPVPTITPDANDVFPATVRDGSNRTFTFTATDGSGNESNCTFTVIVLDTEDPIMVCASPISVKSSTTVDASSSFAVLDNSGETLAITPDPTVIFPLVYHLPGVYYLNFTATDSSGNTASCTVEITVSDSIPPVIQCPSDRNVSTDPGSDTAVLDYSFFIFATDNVDDKPIILPDPYAKFPDLFGIGIHNMYFESFDLAGNTDNCTFTITVRDDEAPVFVCPVNATLSYDPGFSSATFNYNHLIQATDNSKMSLIISPDPDTVFPAVLPIGNSSTFIFSAYDIAGNFGSCMFTITVEDNTVPTLICPPDTTVDNDPNSNVSWIDYRMLITASDVSLYTISPNPSSTFPMAVGFLGHSFSFSAIDEYGNIANCTFTITVQDTENPTLVCPPAVTIYADEVSHKTYVDYSSNITVTDNSGEELTISPDPNIIFPAFYGVGEHILNFTATDSSGNLDACTVKFTVPDTMPPVLECPPVTNANTDTGSDSVMVDYHDLINATDNVDTVLVISLYPYRTFPTQFAIGEHNLSITVADSSGNNVTCKLKLVVLDAENPVLRCPPNTTQYANIDSLTAVVNYSAFITARDNSMEKLSISPNPKSVFPANFPIGVNELMFSTTDSSGNTDSCMFNIKVPASLRIYEKREVTNVTLTSEPNSVIFTASSENDLKENGPFTVVANLDTLTASTLLETVEGDWYFSATDVVTINIYNTNYQEIRINCEIYFPAIKENAKIEDRIPSCYYTHYNGSFWEGIWHSEGCSTIYDQDYVTSGVTCKCNHLTSFTILMKPKPMEENKHTQIMSMLTSCGISISSVFLIITVITISSFRELRQSDRYIILRHLVIALLSVNFFFWLLEADADNSPVSCNLLAVSLHYSLLASFSWMLIMSTDVYMKVKHPFGNHAKRFTYSRVIGWIGPAIIVGVTGCITQENYASDKCWLNTDYGTIWTFLSPVCFIVLVVLVQLFVIGYVAFTKSQQPNQSDGDSQQHLKRIRTLFGGILLLTPAVGLWWIFGILSMFPNLLVLEYIFVTLNAFQGVFIWFSQCVLSKEVRNVIKKSVNNRISQGSNSD